MRRAALAIIAASALFAAGARAQEGGGLSNPLWSTPLEALAPTRDRPVFSPTRRPPPLAAAPAAPANVFAGAAPPPFSLVGTVVGDKDSFAVLMDTSSRDILRLSVGASANGWRVAEVAPRAVKLTRGPESVTLELPKPFPN